MEGVRILDLTRLIPGGLTTQLLADLGAEVIKVEEPGRGDYLRGLAPTPSGQSPVFFLLNQGKKSVSVNLKRPEGREILHRLIPTADVLIEQFRPGVAADLGVSYQTVRELKRDLIYCSFSGFGAQGPYRDRPAHDINFLALAGALHTTGARRPVHPPFPAADIASGFLGAFAILAALQAKQQSGQGQYLDLSLYDAALYLNAVALAAGETFLEGRSPSYGLYETADGRFLALGALEEGFWRRLSDAIGRPDLAEADFSQEGDAREVREILRTAFAQKPVREWDALLRRHDVPASPVVPPEEVSKDPHVRALGLLQDVEVEGEPRLALAHPIRWSPEGPSRRGPAPGLGEHTQEILLDMGYKAGVLTKLAEEGIVEVFEP